MELVKQYTDAVHAAVDKERQRAAATEHAGAIDEELALVISQYGALLTRWENAQRQGKVDISLTRKLDRVVTRRQQIIEEKIALGDLYVTLSHEEREAQEIVKSLRQKLEESLQRQCDDLPQDQSAT